MLHKSSGRRNLSTFFYYLKGGIEMLALTNHGLPSDWSKIASPEAALKKLPVDAIMEVFVGELREADQLRVGDIYNALENVYEFSQHNLCFADWQYTINCMGFWESNDVFFEVHAKKDNTELSLEVVTNHFEGYEDHLYDDVIEEVHQTLLIANERIEQWNNIITKQVPSVDVRPPFEELFQGMVGAFEEIYVEEEWHYTDLYQDEEIFIEEFMFNFIHALSTLVMDGGIEFGPFSIFFYNFGTNYNFSVFRTYMYIDGVDMTFVIFDDFVDSREMHVDLTYAEVVDEFDEIVTRINQNLSQWNEVISNG